jgi:Protein of unknown function (DUF2867)
MDPISSQEFLAQRFRVHAFLADVPLHDVWAVDLPGFRKGITLHEFHARTSKADGLKRVSWPTRALFSLRLLIGQVLGLESEPGGYRQSYFANRLTAEDRTASLVAAGTADGFFRVVYYFENEILLEALNVTVHGAVMSALQQTAIGYRFYLAIYVRKVSWITPVYLALIDPFRRWIVYPAIFKEIQRSWTEQFGPSDLKPRK